MADHEQAYPETDRPEVRGPRSRTRAAVDSMPRWKKRLFVFFLLAAVVGGALQAYSHFSHRAQTPTSPAQNPASESTAPDGAVGFVRSGESPSGETHPETSSVDAPSAGKPRFAWSSTMTKIALSFVGAFIVGMALRLFVKTALLVGLAATAVFAALSYFGVIGEDQHDTLKQTAEQAGDYVEAKAGDFKSWVIAHLPSSTSGLIGLLVGLKKN